MLAPTAQMAALLAERVESHYLSTGLDVWPTPKIRDFGGWVQDQYELQNFSDGTAPRVLDDLEERQVWRQVIAHSNLADGFSDPGGAARAAREAWRALQEFSIPLSALAAYPGAETTALLQWIGDFRARCRELRAVPRCELLAALKPSADTPVALDNPGWRPQIRAWLAAHGAAPLQPMQWTGAAQPTGVRLFASFDAEMADCADWAHERLCADPAFRAFIVIPSAAPERARVTDAFDAALARGRYELHDDRAAPPYAIAGGTPLADFEPVRLALAALEAATGVVSFDSFSRLLRAPAFHDGVADAGVAARLDRELRRAAPAEAELTGWLALSRNVAARSHLPEPAVLQRLQAMQAALPQRRDGLLSQWAGTLVTAWEAGPWSNRAQWSSIAFQAAQRLRELLHSLARASATFGALDLSGALGAVQGAARDTAFQPQTGVAPVWISSQSFDPWLSFDGLWVSGAGAQQLPPAAQPLALLPVQLQRRFGIPAASPAALAQDAAELLGRWRQRAGSLRFSCSGDLAETARVSPLLSDVPVEATADDRREPHWQWLRAQAPAMEVFIDTLGPAIESDEAVGGVRALKSQSLCPFRGFAVTRLQADELDAPQPGFNAMERGTILHGALERIWNHLRDSRALAALDEISVRQLVARAGREAVAETAQRRDPGPVWRRREVRRLEKLLPQWLLLEALRPEFRIETLEAPAQLSLAGLDLKVRIDRIDRLQDGRLLLLDYKTGTIRNDWSGARPDNPQLPIYALCVGEPVAAVAYAQVAAAQSRFMGATDDSRILPKIGRPELEAPDMAAQLALWRTRLEAIATELRTGRAEVDPTRHACRDCGLMGFCRIDPAAPIAAHTDPDAGDGWTGEG